MVQVRFVLHDINEINDGAETFEFAGVLVLEWHDPRQVFDPAVAGVEEKIFQGGLRRPLAFAIRLSIQKVMV